MCKLGSTHWTGCDWISKLGSKSKALSNMHLLDDFAERILRRNHLNKQEYLCKGRKLLSRHLMSTDLSTLSTND